MKLLKLLSFIALALSSCTPDYLGLKAITYRQNGAVKHDTITGHVEFLPKEQARVGKNIIYSYDGWGNLTFECHDCELISAKLIKETE